MLDFTRRGEGQIRVNCQIAANNGSSFDRRFDVTSTSITFFSSYANTSSKVNDNLIERTLKKRMMNRRVSARPRQRAFSTILAFSAGSWPIASDPVGFLALYPVTFLLPPSLIRESSERDDRFMDSLDNGGSGGSRVEVGGSAKRRHGECNVSLLRHNYVPPSSGYTHTHARARARKDILRGCHRGASFPRSAKLANQIGCWSLEQPLERPPNLFAVRVYRR